MNEGWIKMFYRFLDWEWYGDHHMVALYIHLLLKANYKPMRWRGVEYGRGVVLTSREQLASETGLSEKIIRTCLMRLKSSHEITIERASRGSVIILCNYEKYQGEGNKEGQIDGQEKANERPEKGQQRAIHPKEKNQEKIKKEINKERKYFYVVDTCAREDFLELFFSEERAAPIEALCMSLGIDPATLRKMAEEVTVEWEVTNQPLHKDLSDAFRHMVSQIRIKLQRESKTTTETQTTHGTTTSTEQPDEASSTRQRNFEQHILTKIHSPDTPEPDVGSLY